jgi:exodeoxyribonuclease VII large subunit
MTVRKEGLRQKIYSVSELTDKINSLLEENFPFIWISGEISNFSKAHSGHYYFTLKDENSQIGSIMFRGQNRALKFEPSDGMSITGLGRLSVYKPRGNYQIIFEFMEPRGVGALQIAFEQLKDRLDGEGLFDAQYKTALPFLPQKITIVTSVNGAVIHDILKIAKRRYTNLEINIISVRVQGDGSTDEIKNAIKTANDAGCDVIILARGGGSLEDLQAFNSETVARAIFSSEVPIVSAIGHETDYTISDFVADYRAPTPSAAAEIVIPLKDGLIQQIDNLEKCLTQNMIRIISSKNEYLSYCMGRLIDPQKRIKELRIKTDGLINRLIRTSTEIVNKKGREIFWLKEKMNILSPEKIIIREKETITQRKNSLIAICKNILKNKEYQFKTLSTSINALSPLAILERGYSVTRTYPDKDIVRKSTQVSTGQELEIMLSEGTIGVVVNRNGLTSDK